MWAVVSDSDGQLKPVIQSPSIAYDLQETLSGESLLIHCNLVIETAFSLSVCFISFSFPLMAV